MTVPVEKLLPLDNTNFCSFDNMGNAILYNVKINSDDDIIIKSKWEYKKNEKEGIVYKNNISSLDSSSFVLSIGNTLYQYNPTLSPKARDVSIKLCKTKDKSNITCLQSFGFSSKENQKVIFCTQKGSINLYDSRANDKIVLNSNIPKEKGIMSCISESFEKNSFLIGTLDGSLLKYDLRLNTIVRDFKYYNETPILGINLFRTSKNNEYEFNNFDKTNQYIILRTGAEDHEISFWNYSDMNCSLLLKLNIQSDGKNELNPYEVEIPYLENNFNKEKDILNISENNNEECNDIIFINKKLKQNFKYLNKFTYLYNKNAFKRYFSFPIKDEEYAIASHRITNLDNIYTNPNTVQCVLSPFSDYSLTQNYYTYDNSPYIISAGNDKVIRYWDLSKDNVNHPKKSYIINAPNNINVCKVTKGIFDRTTVLQSNEIYNVNETKFNMPGLSEFQNFNGTLYHSTIQDEFDENELKHCTKISDPAHKSIISDLLPLSLNGLNGPINILISSSWDGTVKIWK
jgi:WD40 repeat protein